MSPDSEGLGAAVEAGVDSSLSQPCGFSYFSPYTFLLTTCINNDPRPVQWEGAVGGEGGVRNSLSPVVFRISPYIYIFLRSRSWDRILCWSLFKS